MRGGEGVFQQALASAAGVQFVVSRVEPDFLSAARLDDLLTVSVQPRRFARTYVELTQRAACGDRVLCGAQVTVACVRCSDLRPVPIPEDTTARMKQNTGAVG